MAEHRIYTLSDFDDPKNIKIDNIRKYTGGLVREKIAYRFNDIDEKSLSIAKDMLQKQINKENKIYEALGLKSIQFNQSTGIIENSEELIEQIRNKLYGLEDNGKDKTAENAEKCTKIIGDFIKNLILEKKNLLEKNNVSKDVLEEALYELKNLRESYVKFYEKLSEELKEVANKNSIEINDILRVSEYWNTEINSTLKGLSKKDNPFTLFEENGQINGSLEIEQLKRALKAYADKENDYIGGIGEAGSIFLTKEIEESIIEEVEGILVIKGKRKLKKETTSRWDNISSNKLSDNYKKTIGEAVKELREKKVIDEFFILDDSKNLKADEVFSIILSTNDDKINEIVSFGISNKTGFGTTKQIKFQTSSISSILDGLVRVESSSYSNTKDVREGLLDILLNEAAEIAWEGKSGNADFSLSNINKILKEILNRYAYIWLTGGRSGLGHADFFSLYKHNKLYFVPMSIILSDFLSSPRLVGAKVVDKKLPESDLIDLDKAKRGKLEKGNARTGYVKISGEEKSKELEKNILKLINGTSQLTVSNYTRLNLE